MNNRALLLPLLLVIAKCFRAGFWAFSELKYTVKGSQIPVKHLLDIFVGLWPILCVTTDSYTYKTTKVRRFCLRLPTKGVYYVCA